MNRSPDDDVAAFMIPAGAIYGAQRLFKLRLRSQQLRQGGHHDEVQWVVGFIGDSWVRGSGLPAQGDPTSERYFMPRLSCALQQLYGDAGGGWCGLSYTTSTERRGGSANSNRLYQAGIGSWTTQVNNRPVPDLCTSASSVVGDVIRVTNTTGPTRSVKLHAVPAGTIEYRWNEGGWVTLDLGAGGATPITALAGFPRHGGWTLDLRVAAGPVELAGIDHDSGCPGVRIHNLGAGGSSAQHWASVDAAAWRASIESFGFDTLMTLFGTNDQKLIEPQEHRRCLAALVHTLKRAAPEVDIALGTSPESGDRQASRLGRPMRLYRDVDRSLAIEEGLAHVDLQPLFGDVSEYRYGGPRPWLDASLIHPAVPGMRAIEMLYLCLFDRLACQFRATTQTDAG
jgi:GDSL-like Lipase/Acylhydrolase family